jgi:uncharacterized protein involved in outer membrane biogenesis
MKKWILIGGGLVIVLVVGVGYVFYSKLDSIIKTAIEEIGTRATQTQVKLDGVSVSLTGGTGKLSGLTVANPKEFKTPSAFKLGEISLALDTSTVTSKTVVVKEVVVAAPQVTYELTNTGGSNIDAIRRNIDSFVKQAGGGGPAQPAAKSDPANDTKLVINNLYVRGGKVDVSASMLGGKTMTVALPDIHLKDVGKSKGGATPAEIADQLIDAIGNSATKAVASLNLDALKGAAGQAIEGVKGKFESIPQGTGSTGDAAKKATEGATGAIRGIIGGGTTKP